MTKTHLQIDTEPVVDEAPIEPQDMGVADEPAADMGMNY